MYSPFKTMVQCNPHEINARIAIYNLPLNFSFGKLHINEPFLFFPKHLFLLRLLYDMIARCQLSFAQKNWLFVKKMTKFVVTANQYQRQLIEKFVAEDSDYCCQQHCLDSYYLKVGDPDCRRLQRYLINPQGAEESQYVNSWVAELDLQSLAVVDEAGQQVAKQVERQVFDTVRGVSRQLFISRLAVCRWGTPLTINCLARTPFSKQSTNFCSFPATSLYIYYIFKYYQILALIVGLHAISISLVVRIYIRLSIQEYQIRLLSSREVIFITFRTSMSFGPRSLSPAQIQYLRIGPKAGGSSQTKKVLSDAIRQQKNKEFAGDSSATSSLNKIPKLTYGQFEKTVNNFGVLINKNFGNETSIHQSQKFGKMAHHINQIMLQQKDKPVYNEKKNALLKKIKDRSDNRTSIKTVYEFMGEKLHVTLKSFVLQSQRSNEGGLPIPYLRFLISHVNSSRLIKIVESSIKAQGNQIVVEFDKIESRASHFSNNQAKYQNLDYTFERMGQVLKLLLPYVQFHHVQSNYTQKVYILNKQILQIIQCNFDNVAQIVDKYLQAGALQNAIEKQKKQEMQQKQEYSRERIRERQEQQEQQEHEAEEKEEREQHQNDEG